MRILGAIALIVGVLSFFLWLGTWSYWRFFYTGASVESVGYYIATTCSFLGVLGEYVAIGLLSVGLIIAGSGRSAAAN